MAKSKKEASDSVRLDKWLWAARFFKTRSLATEAINGGHVHLNGVRGKPSRAVNIGDELRIKKGELEFIIKVVELSARRGPASVAQTLYAETEASQTARQAHAEQRRLLAASGIRPPQGRPNKRDRRHIIRFTRKVSD